MKKKNHDISSKWEFTTAAAHKQSAGLYSPQRIGARWKWSCLGVWVIGMGGPMVGDGFDGSESSNDDVCWAGKGVVIPDYSPQWRTMKGWIILMFLYYRTLKVWKPPSFCSFFKFPIDATYLYDWQKPWLSKNRSETQLTYELLLLKTRQCEFQRYITWSTFVLCEILHNLNAIFWEHQATLWRTLWRHSHSFPFILL